MDHVHILKVNVEGYEPLVLKGARESLEAKKIDFILMEVNGKRWETTGWNVTKVNNHHERLYIYI